jgi:protoporphyrinogen oxidase
MNIAVIGAGAAGLTAAWELVKTGQQVTIIEASGQVGGLASGFQLPHWDWPLEKFYHHWFATDTDILRLIDEIGCGSKVIFSKPQPKFWIDDKLYNLSSPLNILRLPLSIIGKLRMTLAGAYLKFPHRWQSLDHISAYEWLHQTMGKEVYEKVWAAVLEGKFKASYREIPLSWLWAHIYNRSAEIAIYDGGFQALWDDFAQRLRTRGVTIRLNTPINKLLIQDGKPALLIDGAFQIFDSVISTLSPPLMLKIAPDLADTDYAKQMLALKNVGAICVVFALKQPLFPDRTFSLTLPSDTHMRQGFPFTNLYEHTNLTSSKHYGDDHLLYCVEYGSSDDPRLHEDDTQLTTQFSNALPRLNPAFDQSWIRDSWVFKTPIAQPIPELNAGKHIPSIKTPLLGIYWITMNQMHPWGKGTNFAVRLGKKAAHMLLHDFSPPL